MTTRKLFLFVSALALFGVSFAAAQQTGSATINLKGTVAPFFEFTVTQATGLEALDLEGENFTKTIAMIKERSNRRGGYNVTVASANGWKLKGADAENTDSVEYTLSYDGVSVDQSTSTAAVRTAAPNTNKAGIDAEVAITTTNLNAEVSRNADVYSDTLTLTMATVR
jgi:hypothetical protein